MAQRALVLLGVLLLTVACANTGTGSTAAAASAPQVTSRPLGGSFVAVDGTGFPAGSAAEVTGTTPQGTTTVAVTTDGDGKLRTSVQVPDGYQGPMTVRAAAGEVVATTTADAGTQSAEPAADAGVRPLGDVSCTSTTDVGSVRPAAPGEVLCLTGSSEDRLTITGGGTPASPAIYSGGGEATVRGVDVTADNVVVEGFISTDASNMGAKLLGSNITFRDNTITHPVYDGDDTDGIRFFGNDITILHNMVKDVSDGSDCDQDGCGEGPHPDCMQTFYSNQYPTSSRVTIEGNRCEGIAAQCLIAEGPVLPGEGINGPGQSADWIFFDNYCETGAAQAVQLKDIKNATVAGNFFDGSNNKAIALSDASTGTHVGGNKLNSQTSKLITFDDGNEAPGYVGPPPDQ